MDPEMDRTPPAPPPDYNSAVSMGPTQSPGHDPFKAPVGSTAYPPAVTPTHTNFEPTGLELNPYPPSASPGHINFQAPNAVGPNPYPPVSMPYPPPPVSTGPTPYPPPPVSMPYPPPPAATPTHTNFQPVTLAPSPTNYHPGTMTPAAVPANTQFVPLAPGSGIRQGYLPMAIISCIFCNWFCLGSVALYNAIRTREALNNGNVSEAQEYYRLTRRFAAGAFLTFFLAFFLYMIVNFIKFQIEWHKI